MANTPEKGRFYIQLKQEHTIQTRSRPRSPWGFGRGRRFTAPKIISGPPMMAASSTFSKRTCTFGAGKRWEPFNPAGADAPSPETYTIPSTAVSKTVKFGPPHMKEQACAVTPGPGTYRSTSTFGKEGARISFGRKVQQPKQRVGGPAPGDYEPSFKLVHKKSFSGPVMSHGTSHGLISRPKTATQRMYETCNI